LVYLTQGEAGPTNGLVAQSELGATRTKEIQQVGKILGVHALELFDFPDSGLKDVAIDTIKNVAVEMISKYQPDVLLSFDSEVGLYGHPDHRVASTALEEVYLQGKGSDGFSPKQYFQLTLSPKQIAIALEISPGFQKNYPKTGRGLPPPDFSVRTTEHFSTLVHMMEAHATQQQVFRDLMPYREELPQFVYSRVFDREYFWEFRPIP
jgi:LmbE family N-acetylglucosaminyl deacetylase